MKIIYLLICVTLLTVILECDPVEAGWFKKVASKLKNVGKKIGKGVKNVGKVVLKGKKAVLCGKGCLFKHPGAKARCLARCAGKG